MTQPMKPEVAVVIPAHRRDDGLAAALAALAGQTLAYERYEVIVVHGSDGEIPLAEGPAGFRVRHVRHPPTAPASKRNHGWRCSDATLVAFTDDDCRPAPDWLERLLEAADGRADLIVQGRTAPDPGEAHLMGPLSRTVEVNGPAGLFQSCNIAYPRALLERVGGFDESFLKPCGEDVDLGWRVREAGAEAVFVPDALVYHAVSNPGLAAVLRRTLDWGDAVRVVRDYPQLRSLLTWRLFWKRSHPAALLALAGVAVAVRRGRLLPAALAAFPWIDHHLRRRSDLPVGSGIGVRNLPGQALVDLTELAVMAAASVRHRSPML